MFSLEKTCLNWVPFLKMSFFLHEDRYKRDSEYIFFQRLSILFSVLIRILKFFSSHHTRIHLWRIQKYKFHGCKTTTAWVIGLGPKNSCSWPQCAGYHTPVSHVLVDFILKIFAPIWGIYFFSALQYFFTLWRRVYQQIRMEMYNASVTDDTNFTIYTYFYIYFKNTIAIF